MKKSAFYLNENQTHKFAGVSLMIAGLFYAFVQFIHPKDELSAVSTSTFVVVAVLSIIMALFSMHGIYGLYRKQASKIGLLGFIGMMLFNLFWLVSAMFSFVEAFVLPLIVGENAEFVLGLVELFSDTNNSTANLGIFPVLASLSAVFYVGGSLLLGIQTIRHNYFSKIPAYIFAASALLTILASFVPYPINRVFALPMSVAFIWLGYELLKSKIEKIIV